MRTSPAFQFYPADFISDQHVEVMTNQELGCYIRLLCSCWIQGSIPADVTLIARICRETPARMKKLWPAIEPCFEECEAVPDRLIHKRLDRERQKQMEYRRAKSRAGKMGVEAKRKKRHLKLAEPQQS